MLHEAERVIKGLCTLFASIWLIGISQMQQINEYAKFVSYVLACIGSIYTIVYFRKKLKKNG